MGEKPMHWISVPHEGPREFEFELAWVEFSDGVTRGICTHVGRGAGRLLAAGGIRGEPGVGDIRSGGHARIPGGGDACPPDHFL